MWPQAASSESLCCSEKGSTYWTHGEASAQLLNVNCAIGGERVGNPGREREIRAVLESSMWKPLEISLSPKPWRNGR